MTSVCNCEVQTSPMDLSEIDLGQRKKYSYLTRKLSDEASRISVTTQTEAHLSAYKNPSIRPNRESLSSDK
jgi:hypothetical protein